MKFSIWLSPTRDLPPSVCTRKSRTLCTVIVSNLRIYNKNRSQFHPPSTMTNAPVPTPSPFKIGGCVIFNDIDYRYITKIDKILKVCSIFNAIPNATKNDTPFTSCRPNTMANQTRLCSGNDHHANTITTINNTEPPSLVPEAVQTLIRRSPLDCFKSILLSARQWNPESSTHHPLANLRGGTGLVFVNPPSPPFSTRVTLAISQ